jgi:LysM repeat protein
VSRDDWRRYAAPAAFLLAVTIAVVLIRSGINSGKARTPVVTPTVPSSPRVTTTKKKKTTTTTKKKASGQRYWTVQPGDTFNVISSKTGVPMATIARLNPNASSTSLYIGEKIRIR